MRSNPRILPACAVLLCLPSLVSAGHWYVGAGLGQATTEVSDGTVNDRLADEGLSGSAKVSDTSRQGWRVFGGYAFNPWFDVEAGYAQLGDIALTLSGTGAVSASQLEAIRPASGAGFELGMRGKYPFTESFSGFVRAGLFHWEQQYDLSNGDSGRFSGDDVVYGLGAEWRIDERWSARFAWDRYAVADDTTSLITLGLTRHFAAGKAPLVAAEPARAPVETSAATAPVEPAPAESAQAESAQIESVPADVSVQAESVQVDSAQTESAPVAQTPAETIPPPRVIQFGFKRTRLTGDLSAIDATADYLAAHPQARVQITGHTDSAGAEGFNPYLSRLRAQAVADALTARGVASGRITLEGRGAAEPVADNQTRAGRAQNRRVEIVIVAE